MRLLRELPEPELSRFMELSNDERLFSDKFSDYSRYYGFRKAREGEDDMTAEVKELDEIMGKSLTGAPRFCNFCSGDDGGKRIRFVYDWGADGGMHFQGVGYILVEEFIQGHFNEKTLAKVHP